MKSISNKFFFVFVLSFSFIALNSKSFPTSLMPSEDEYLLVTEKLPAPVGGIDALVKKVLAETSLKGKGKLYLLVYVNTSGSVDEVKVVKGIGGSESQATDIVGKYKFTPGMNNNTPVKSKVALALNL